MDAAKYSKSDLELRSVAYHEAGHAVVAWVKELELHHVTIEAEDFMVGHVTHERFTDEENPEWSESPGTRQRIQDNIQVSLAGAQAQRKLGDDPDSIEHGRAGDAADANRLMALLTEDWDEQGMYWELLKYQTKKMIERNWWLVEAFAQELLNRLTMTGIEATEFLQIEYDKKTGVRR